MQVCLAEDNKIRKRELRRHHFKRIKKKAILVSKIIMGSLDKSEEKNVELLSLESITPT
jgi:hypothetical protein